jgi:radical SAM superfamily enzyme YgiQ (UPF0313 family)
MKLLLVGINSRYTHSNPAIYYLKKYIDDLDYSVSVHEYTIKENPHIIALSIMKERPDVVALSVYIWNREIVDEVIKKIRYSSPHVKIITGGPEVSFDREISFNMDEAPDYIICGPGEEGFRRLAVGGFESVEKVIKVKNPPFNRIPFPYNDDDMAGLKNRYIYYESSRGCPFKCSYCLSSRFDLPCEFRNINSVKDELDYICSFSPGLVKFIDRTFNSKSGHYRKIWEYLVEKHRDYTTSFHFEIYPELLTDDDIYFLKSVPQGLFQFEMGIQSTSGETLAAVKRRGDWKRIEEIIQRLAYPGNIHLHVDLIAGLPLENYTGFSESYNRVYALNAEHFQCGFLKVLPGTEMRERSNDYRLEFTSHAPYEIISNRWISEKEMSFLKKISALTDLIRNSGKFKASEKLMLKLYGNAFSFYENLVHVSSEIESISLRSWESIASLLLKICEENFPLEVPELTDSMRWDWCCSMKSHYFPPILKSDLTRAAKREGYRFFIEKSYENTIKFNGFSFPAGDLRKSFFFRPLTDSFMAEYMDGRDALFLPDKKIIFYNCKS